MTSNVRNLFPVSDYDVTHVSTHVYPAEEGADREEQNEPLKRRPSVPARYRRRDSEFDDVTLTRQKMQSRNSHDAEDFGDRRESRVGNNTVRVDDVGEGDDDILTPEARIVRSHDGTKEIDIRVDVIGFKADDIRIVTQGNLLQVSAKGTTFKTTGARSIPGQGQRVYRELKRQFALPLPVSAERLQAVIQDGFLLISGPIGVGGDSGKSKKKSKRVKFAF